LSAGGTEGETMVANFGTKVKVEGKQLLIVRKKIK
jgi:hypothetical protein